VDLEERLERPEHSSGRSGLGIAQDGAGEGQAESQVLSQIQELRSWGLTARPLDDTSISFYDDNSPDPAYGRTTIQPI
jgi:hypothetical protein